MSEKIDVPANGVPLIVKYDGIFDLDNLYRVIHEWIVNQRFYFEEDEIKHKVPSPAGAEQDYLFTGWKNINEYARFNITVHIKLYDLKEVEVVKEGRKKILSKSRLRVYVSGNVELDYKERFENNRFLLALRKFYNKYILKEGEGIIGGVWWDQLYYHLNKLTTVIKEFLDMESKGNAYYDMW